jgi:hypothetical protein
MDLEKSVNIEECSVTSEKLPFEYGVCPTYGAIITVNSGYGAPTDNINEATGTMSFVISQSVLQETLKFWKEILKNYNPNEMVKEINSLYKV